MSTVVIRPEALEMTLKKLLQKYGDEAYEMTAQSAKSVSRKATSELKGSAPGGSYSGGWSHKSQTNGLTSYSETVYNRHYQLTHLLEKPHETGGGGHYPKNVDYTGTIAKVEDKYTDMFLEEVLRKL